MVTKEESMKAEQLSLRLARVANYIKQYANVPIRLADIGSDHGYLPVHLVLNNIIDYAIAGEVVIGPFQSAQREVKLHQMESIIDVRLGDGLDVIHDKDHINTISICGMGGNLIRDILEKNLHKVKRNTILVLQANTSEQNLRTFLNQQQFQILAETIVEDQNRLYEIIVVKKVDQVDPLSEKELMFGPFNLKQATEEFYSKWQHELQNLNRVLSSVRQSKQINTEKEEALKHSIQLIEEVLADGN